MESRTCVQVASKVWLVLLDLHHELVHVDELSPVWVGRHGPVLQHLVEPVVVLHETSQRLLEDGSAVLEVGKGAQDLFVDFVQGTLQTDTSQEVPLRICKKLSFSVPSSLC